MTLEAGNKLGRYEIRAKIGEGGMGEVYLARDTQLGRDVAVKVLPSEFSQDAERLHRFEQEACAASALNHPNILTIYDVGTHDGSPYVVSELLEGQTLRQRISGATLPQRKTIDYALKIAHGLAAAHEKGIVHRDLKPDNLFVTNDGRVKILDFGLAKLLGAGDTQLSQTGIPTRRVDTDPGKVMGTVGYMSPEQVKGRAVDHRSDIFSFGAILYEMLSGRRAFHGESAAETMSAILKEDPPELSETNQRISPALERVVNHCLEKNPEERFHSARDLAFALEALSGSTSVATQTAITAPAFAPQWVRKHALAGWIIAGAALVLAIVAFAVAYFRGAPKSESPTATRFYVSPPESVNFSGANDFISPDGQRIVFSAIGKDGKRVLWIRSLDSLDARPLPGTDEGIQAFWSPDSRYIGFFSGSKLKKIEVAGGPATTLADGSPRGGTWNREGVIVFSGTAGGTLFRISSNGGSATQVTTLDTTQSQTVHSWPHFLPDGRHFLYLARSASREKSGIYVGSVDASPSKLVINADSTPIYAPPGYLLFVRERTLMAQAFDADRLQVTGDAFPIAEQVGFNSGNGRAFFSVSDNGVLVYRTGIGAAARIAWLDRAGKEIGQVGTTGLIGGMTLAPDDKRVVASRLDSQSGTSDLWLVEQDRETRFTFDPANEGSPIWSPDGSQIAFNSSRSGVPDLYVKPSSGAGSEELLVKSMNPKGAQDWSPDGRYILYGELDPKTNADIWVLPLFGDRKPFLFLQTPFAESQGRFSPNGKWLAYGSAESGTNQVYVRPFPPAAGQWMVSVNGGIQPRWRADGKELFYIGADRKLTVVEVKEDGSNFTAGTPKPLFEARFAFILPGALYDVTRDGQRFAMIVPVEESSPAPLTVVLNWTAGIKKQ